MKTYREIETGVIEWREVDGESTTIGLIIEGQTKTRQIQTGETEPELDEEGNVIAEAQQIFEDEVYSPWDELLDSGAEIHWISEISKVAQAKETERTKLKNQKQQSIAGLIYHPLINLSAIQVRPQDWANIEAQLSVGSGAEWIMANNSVEFVERTDLAAALAFGKEEYQRITKNYIEGVKALYDNQ